MKKLTYSLIALILVICVVSAAFFFKLSSTTKLLDEANERINSLTETIEGLNLEKDQWDVEKLQLGQSISTVRSSLIDTLANLDSIGALIGLESEVQALEAIEETIAPEEEIVATEEPEIADETEEPVETEDVGATDTPEATSETEPEEETTVEPEEVSSTPEKTE